MIPFHPWVRSQVTQSLNNFRMRKRHISSTLSSLVCALYFHWTPIDDYYEAIRATDLTLGLRRIPAGFNVTVQVDDAQWQTTNKSVHVDLDVVEWNEQIVL
jgi:hypothetical protein